MAPKRLLPPREVIKHGHVRWLVDLRPIGGGRSYCETFQEALDEQKKAVQDRDNLGSIAFDLPHDTRVRYLAIERKLLDAGTTIEEVVEDYFRRHRPSVQRTVADAINDCITAKTQAGGRKRAVAQLGYSLKSFGDTVPDALCADITLEHVESWLHNEKWQPQTRKNKLIDLRTFFSFCIKRNWIGTDPSAGMEEIRFDPKPVGILTIDQCKRLLNATLEHRKSFLPFIVLGLFCGVRPEEIKLLSWDNVNLDTGYVEIPAHVAKRIRGRAVARQRRLIKLQPNVIEWLKLKGDLPPEGWQDRWDVVRKAAGFAVTVRRKNGQQKRGKPSKGDPWPKNAMRHSFCSYCLPVFGEEKESQWAGHSPEIALSRYRELTTEETAQLFWAIFPPT